MPGPRPANYKPNYEKIKKQHEAIKDFPARVVRGAKVVGGAIKNAFDMDRKRYIKSGRYGPRGMIRMTEEEAAKKWDMRKMNGEMRRWGGPSR